MGFQFFTDALQSVAIMVLSVTLVRVHSRRK